MTEFLVPVALPANLPGSLTQTALILNPGIPYEHWECIVEQLCVMEKGVQWWLGDALNYGEISYGETYAQAAKATGLETPTLWDYKYVASRVKSSLRNKDLSWSHHKAVAHLDREQQRLWLGQAFNNTWGVARLREEIESSKQPASPPSLVGWEDQTKSIDEMAENLFESIGALPEADQIAVFRRVIEQTGGENTKSKRIQKALSVLDGETTNIHVSDDSYEWYTPVEFAEAARNVMGGIDLDPASTLLANETIQAHTIFTREENGLCQAWRGRVFLNPPYNMPLVQQFTDKAIEEFDAGNLTEAIVLINNSTDTDYCQSLLTRFPACFINGRLKFWNPNRDIMQARQGQVFVYLTRSSARTRKFAHVFGKFGAVVVAL